MYFFWVLHKNVSDDDCTEQEWDDFDWGIDFSIIQCLRAGQKRHSGQKRGENKKLPAFAIGKQIDEGWDSEGKHECPIRYDPIFSLCDIGESIDKVA